MLNQNTNMFIEENAFENISWIPSLCTQSQWVDPKMILRVGNQDHWKKVFHLTT